MIEKKQCSCLAALRKNAGGGFAFQAIPSPEFLKVSHSPSIASTDGQ